MGFWTYVSRFILTNRILILLAIAAVTVALVSQSKNIKISNTEANMLPSDHPASITYDKFLDVFGEEGNLIIIAVKDSTFFTPKKFNNWSALSQQLDSIAEVDFTFSLGDIKKLKKDVARKRFVVEPLYDKQPETVEEVNTITKALFRDLPFFDNFIYNKETKTIQTLIYLKKDIVNTVARKDFVLKKLNPIIAQFEKDNNLNVHVSGMPYIRTMNSQSIVDEIGTFVGLAFGVTALIFFFFFRSFRATFIAMSVVAIGVVWAFGIIGAFQYELTVLTALIPPLIIVIGVPNAIFLINKYQQEIKKHGNKAKSLQRVISKIGNATLMTNITTASGFATFIFTKSQLLREFGIIASINIMVIFILSILLIPIIYSFMPIPKDKHLKHLEKRWVEKIILFLENIVRHHRFAVYAATLFIVIVSMIGVYMIKVSGSLIDDMPKSKTFYKDIVFFEEQFGGIMPLEIMIDTKKNKGVSSLATLKRMEKLDETIDDIPQLSKSVSILNIVKYSKQAFYNGNPKYYKLPTSQEKNFILSYTKNSNTNSDLLKNFVDSTGRYARMTTFMKDVGTNKMAQIEERIEERVAKVFPKEKYDVTITGKALLFLKGTKYLTKNLIVSLSLAIFLIAVFMAWIFRSFRMIVISIIPNMLPLLMTAGIMGYIGVPIKPSTILVFSIAFGISVDDTIHFLAKYRQELQANNWRIKKSVYNALRETGVSMFYTSIVLYFGFLVFTASSFGGTIALGGLVSITLLLAMVSNLVLLPSLLLSLDQNIANKSVLKEPSIEILDIDAEN